MSQRDEVERRRRRGLLLNPHRTDMSSSRHRCVSGAKRSRLKEIRAACGVLTANDMTKDGGAGVLSLSQGYGTKEQKPGGEPSNQPCVFFSCCFCQSPAALWEMSLERKRHNSAFTMSTPCCLPHPLSAGPLCFGVFRPQGRCSERTHGGADSV